MYYCPNQECEKFNNVLEVAESQHRPNCTSCGYPLNSMFSNKSQVLKTISAVKEKIESKPIKSFNSNFVFQSPITVTETKGTKTLIKGTLLSEGLSKNGRLYTIETLAELDNLKDIPIYVGTGKNNKHTKASGIIGKIVKTIFDKVARKVRFIAEITNKAIAETVKSGWGISVGGKGKGEILLDSLGKLITHVKHLFLEHVQLLLPTTQRGQESAKVEVVVNETMTFSNYPRISKNQIISIVKALVKEGVI
jgi:hypothetical protein